MYVRGGSRPSDGKRAGPTIYELNARGEKRSVREIPRLVAVGVAITWHAGRRELTTMAVLELLSGVGVAAEVVVGRRVLEAILATQHAGAGAGAGLAGVWPSAVLLGVITALLGLAGAVLRAQQRMLSELTQRYAQDRILDVTCAVELAAFDQPEFHDRVARAQAGVMRAPQLVFGLQGLGRSVAGAIGAAVALLAVAPLLVPVALVALIPGWLASGRRGRAFYTFGIVMTPRDRERSYLAGLLTGRDPAKEVRAFGLASFPAGPARPALRRADGRDAADLQPAATRDGGRRPGQLGHDRHRHRDHRVAGRLAPPGPVRRGGGRGGAGAAGAAAGVRRAERRDAARIRDVHRGLPGVHQASARSGTARGGGGGARGRAV